MKIGIDLDGVVFDSEKEFRIYSEIYDIIYLKQNSKIENRELRYQDRFNWSNNEIKDFREKYYNKIIKESNFMPGAKYVLNLLKKENHKLIIITARGKNNNSKTIEITNKILIKNNMNIKL